MPSHWSLANHSLSALLQPVVGPMLEPAVQKYGIGLKAALEALEANADRFLRGQIAALSAGAGDFATWFNILGSAWHQLGRPTVMPEEELMAVMDATSLENAPVDFLKLPHPVTAVVLPPSHRNIGVECDGDVFFIEALLLCDSFEIQQLVLDRVIGPARGGGREALRELWSDFPDEVLEAQGVSKDDVDMSPLDKPYSTPTVRGTWGVDSERIVLLLALAPDPNDLIHNSNMKTFWLHLSHDDLDRCVAESMKLHGWEGDDHRLPRQLLELASKLVLYINSQNSALRNVHPPRSPNARRPSKKARAIRERQHRLFGRRVVLGPPTDLKMYDAESREASSPGPQALHTVRGHFRRVVVGEGRQGREIRWINAYTKGDADAGRVGEREYDVTL